MAGRACRREVHTYENTKRGQSESKTAQQLTDKASCPDSRCEVCSSDSRVCSLPPSLCSSSPSCRERLGSWFGRARLAAWAKEEERGARRCALSDRVDSHSTKKQYWMTRHESQNKSKAKQHLMQLYHRCRNYESETGNTLLQARSASQGEANWRVSGARFATVSVPQFDPLQP